MFGLDYVLFGAGCMVGYWYWTTSQANKQIALAACQRHCEQVQVQLLDQTVALQRVWFKRDSAGQMRVWRRYGFEFSVSGFDRYQGYVVTLGRRVTNIHLAAHRV